MVNLVVSLFMRKEKGCETMQKLLIADTVQSFAQAVSKQLKSEYSVTLCQSGRAVLEAFSCQAPDVLVLDLHLPDMDSLQVLRTLRSCGHKTKIIVTGYLQSPWVFRELESLQVLQFFTKPSNVSAVVSCIRDIAAENFAKTDADLSAETVIHQLMLSLGFRMGLARYHSAYVALLMKYQGEDGGVTKCLYPKVAKACGGNSQQVEKAIRDGIKDAFTHGDHNIWQMYFPAGKDKELRCPSNEVFLARMAYAVSQRIGEDFALCGEN